METNIIGSFTEIYISGGGNFLTQSAATRFHTFVTRKILGKDESLDDWREVTATERAKLEESDAAWTRPPQLFIDRFNLACELGCDPNGKSVGTAGGYNESTGYFECNGILDIDYEEAMEMMRIYDGSTKLYQGMGSRQVRPVRTLFPIRENCANGGQGYASINFSQNDILGLISIQFNAWANGWWFTPFRVNGLNNTFCQHTVEEVGNRYSPLDVSAVSEWNGFYRNSGLREVRLKGLKTNPHLSGSPLISLASLQYAIENAQKLAQGFDFSVHPAVYARIMDEDNAEWHALLGLAEGKNIRLNTNY